MEIANKDEVPAMVTRLKGKKKKKKVKKMPKKKSKVVFKPVLAHESSRRITKKTITRPQTQHKSINEESKGDSKEIEDFK